MTHSKVTSLLILLLIAVYFIAETAYTNFIIFGLKRLGLEPMIYHTWGEYSNHNTTDVAWSVLRTYKYNNIYWTEIYENLTKKIIL